MAQTSIRRGVGRGLAAGAIGTAAMTGAQTLYLKAQGSEGSDTPAQAARTIWHKLTGREVPEERMGLLNNVMHWAYGTGWGVVLGLGRERLDLPTLPQGLLFGTLVWAWSLVELPALGLAPPPWEYDVASIAPDLGFHLVYGLGAAAGATLLARAG
jgi:hypothetical protein